MEASRPSIILVTGVSGSGKTTIGKALADRLGWDYAEADDFHPEANVEKMRSGVPLTDEDRMPWLRAIASWIDERLKTGRPAVVSTSAIKRRYRDMLRRPGVRAVFLDGDKELIKRRITARKGHFFPAALLDSQFRDLERPEPDENIVEVPVDGEPDATVEHIVDQLHPADETG